MVNVHIMALPSTYGKPTSSLTRVDTWKGMCAGGGTFPVNRFQEQDKGGFRQELISDGCSAQASRQHTLSFRGSGAGY